MCVIPFFSYQFTKITLFDFAGKDWILSEALELIMS